MPEVSLIASAIRTPLYQMFLDSLAGTSVNVEVIFSGHVWPKYVGPKRGGVLYRKGKVEFKYILTEFIKPAQCYEVARRAATGDVIVWVADDCEFINDVLGKGYRFWESLGNKKAVLSIQTKEYYLSSPTSVDANFCDMTLHSFIGGNPRTPRMAPLGMMSREYLEELGGIDRRYICGQYENDVMMRVYADGGGLAMFGDKETYIDINHIEKQRIVQPGATWQDFQCRPFALGYTHDRKILEGSWITPEGFKMHISGMAFKIPPKRNDVFEPFTDENLLTVSQGPKGIWA
jgi:hypothetical protein